MARRWINSADVEVSDAGALSVQSAPSSTFVGGTKTVAAAATPEKLIANATPCRAVWIGTRMNTADGTALNTRPVMLGDLTSQTMALAKDDFKGFLIPIDDASKVYVKVFANGEGVAYRILI